MVSAGNCSLLQTMSISSAWWTISVGVILVQSLCTSTILEILHLIDDHVDQVHRVSTIDVIVIVIEYGF